MPSISAAGTKAVSPSANPAVAGATERSSSGGTVCCFCPQVRSSKSNNLQQAEEAETTEISGNHNSNNTHGSIGKIQEKRASQKETQTVKIVRIPSSDKKPRSKSIKIFDKETGTSYYDCYRKCQSSRELSNSVGKSRSRNNSIDETVDKEDATPAGFHGNHRSQSHHRNAVSVNAIGSNGTPSCDRDSLGVGVKPKSWDNVMVGGTTKSFGGYGFGFGYGYYPSRENSTDRKSVV